MTDAELSALERDAAELRPHEIRALVAEVRRLQLALAEEKLRHELDNLYSADRDKMTHAELEQNPADIERLERKLAELLAGSPQSSVVKSNAQPGAAAMIEELSAMTGARFDRGMPPGGATM